MPPELLTVSQAADFLGVSASSIRRWADDGLIPHEVSTTSKARWFRRADLSAFEKTMWVSK